MPGEGAADTPLLCWVHLSHGSQLCLLPRSTGTLRRSSQPGLGAGSKRLPLGPDSVLLCLWPDIWVVDSDSGGHTVTHRRHTTPSALAPGPRQAATGWQHPPQNTCQGCPDSPGPACDKGPTWREWACLLAGRAIQGPGQVTGSQQDLYKRKQFWKAGGVGWGQVPSN